jgi:hypothetical protein
MKTTTRATCSCVLLLAGWVFCCGQSAGQPIEATLCDLYQHPEQYAGKIIKVRGGSVGDLHIEDIMHDSHAEPCSAHMRIVVVFPDQVRPAPGYQLVQDESYKELVEALHRPGPIHIDATYEGRFDAAFAWRDHERIRVGEYAGKGYGKKHEYDGRIVLHQVYDVWAKLVPRR